MNIYDFDYIDVGLNKVHKDAKVYPNVTLGKNNIIMPFAIIGYPGFLRGIQEYTGSIHIGDNNIIGCHTAIMVGDKGKTTIGDDNLVMNYVNVGHNCQIGNSNELGAGSILAGNIIIGDGNKIKTHCTLRNRIEIGDNNTVGQGSNVVKSVGNDQLIKGNPAK